MIFPGITIKEAAKRETFDPEMTFLCDFYKKIDVTAPADLENISSKIFIYRINRDKFLSGHRRFNELFRFLDRSYYFKDITLNDFKEIRRCNLPKMVESESQGGAKSLNNLNSPDKKERKKAIIKYIIPATKKNVHNMNVIYNNIPDCASLEPCPNSHSPDFIFSLKVGSIKYRLGIQQKTRQIFTPSLIVEEAKKFTPVGDASRHTLILLGFSEQNINTQYYAPNTTITYAIQNRSKKNISKDGEDPLFNKETVSDNEEEENIDPETSKNKKRKKTTKKSKTAKILIDYVVPANMEIFALGVADVKEFCTESLYYRISQCLSTPDESTVMAAFNKNASLENIEI